MANQDLENTLNDFDPARRQEALARLAPTLPAGSETHRQVNMHFHSFFSYNACGWSPARIAWESRKAGLYAAGLCDFDVIDGMDEFLNAGEILGLRTAVFVETRAYLKEYGTVDINSPGEPGVTYIMGAGFARPIQPGQSQFETLAMLRRTAGERNLALIKRVNDAIPLIAVDYDKDVKVLTPSGTATERHIIAAYVNKVALINPELVGQVSFWCDLLGVSRPDGETLLANRPKLEEAVRSKLVKKGGVGYVQPAPGQFPTVDSFIQWVLSCRAIPMVAWLDGASGGESDPETLLDCMMAKGAAALNIIPDRNWNFKDAQTARVKQEHLKRMVQAAEARNLPINIGTEMNKLGLPFVDDLAGAALMPYREIFLKGARIMVGHTLLFRFADFSYCCDKVAALGGVSQKNAFFEKAGALPAVTRPLADRLRQAGADRAFDLIADAVKAGNWTV